MPFNIAISGLNAASTDLEVTGNNIANASTNGFKESRAEFADIYAASAQSLSATDSGKGVRVTRVAQQFAQGTVDFTSSSLDLAISGEGFFQIADPDGTVFYTRAGAFNADKDGFIVNHANQRLQGYEAFTTAAGDIDFLTNPSDMQLPSTDGPPNATTEIEASLNMNASDGVPPNAPFDPADPDSFNDSTAISIYDSQGNSHTTQLFFRKINDNQWEVYPQVANGTFPNGTNIDDPVTLNFNLDGTLANGPAFTLNTFTVNTTTVDPINMDLDFGNTTQYGAPFSVNNLIQDGFTSGRLAGIDIDATGVVFSRFTNGQSTPVYKVALAKFNNNQGLRPVGDTNWAESFESGQVQLGSAGTSNFGNIQSGALEASNVDLAAQLVNLIVAQRNFQANAQVISTADAITQTIINIR